MVQCWIIKKPGKTTFAGSSRRGCTNYFEEFTFSIREKIDPIIRQNNRNPNEP